ncbi:BamA/TamA family outer membrane protein [Prochlorococcus sp. MIT 1307]|uniref:BamA/TamA family outer membrane protein n=1 Tax=Prochlorococcus sp. MIT 1307 TaxID=3096219 RepID=UPI002A766158|nr:BamA/TamA family outer membrane protein [Prochlorococcus sp. MIT 1307]
MARFLSAIPSWLLHRGTYGLALALPALVGTGFSSLSNQEKITYEKSKSPKDVNVAQFARPTGERKGVEPSPQGSGNTRVLITEVVIEGIDGHPEQERLEFAAYDAMSVRPGSNITREELKLSLDAIYSTGWFSGVRIEPINGPLGVQLLVEVDPNPVLKKVKLLPTESKIPPSVIDNIFKSDYGKTLNLNALQVRIKELKNWYTKEGYSLARISGPNRITPDGIVELKIGEGTVSGIEIQFLNKDGDLSNQDGKVIKGKTRPWVIKREISMKPGDIFNRNQLEGDIKRLYSTSLFSDVKVTLRPVTGSPGSVIIVLGITEQSTGSLSGGIGYSGGQGAFGQLGLKESNFFGKAWNSGIDLTYGQYGALVNFTFSDPWIRGDKYRTSFRSSLFLSREVPQEFRSQSGGSIRSVKDYYDANTSTAYEIQNTVFGPYPSVSDAKAANPNVSWFDYEGDSIVLERVGGGFSFARPLNGGDPYKKVPWRVLVGMNVQQVKAIDYAGNSRPYGVLVDNLSNNQVPNKEVICVSFNCAAENNLFSVRTAATYNTLNDSRNPTSGDFMTVGTEQFVSVGEDSPTFNRARTSYSHFIPVNWLKIAKGCRPKSGEKANCPQTIAFQVKAGSIVGDLPPYEAFCLGGSSSVRGWNNCDLAVGRNFGEGSVEYRFPVWKLLSAAFFVDGATDFGSQNAVPGKPGKLLGKNGSGFSPGAGLIVNTPIGPLRLEGAKRDFDGDWRFNLGVGWKF